MSPTNESTDNESTDKENNEKWLGNQPKPDKCNAETALLMMMSQGNETESTLENVKNLTSKNVNDTLKLVLGTDDLSDTINKTLDRSKSDILSVKQQQQYEIWKKLTTKINTLTAETIAAAREVYVNGNPQYGLRDFIKYYATPDISSNLTVNKTMVNDYIESISSNYDTLYNIYTKDNLTLNFIINLLEMKDRAIQDTVGNIQFYQQQNNVDIRKNLYEFERIELYTSVLNVVLIIYYALLVLYIIFGKFIKLEQYKDKKFYIIAAIYILFPFSLKYIFAGIIFIYEYILHLFGVRKEILSYSDLVRANNINNIYTAPVTSSLDVRKVTGDFRRFFNSN